MHVVYVGSMWCKWGVCDVCGVCGGGLKIRIVLYEILQCLLIHKH